MALNAGTMQVTVEFAKDLKDQDWFGKQDPYCILRVGGQQFRTRTAVDGGKNPVWNETFTFNCINENTVDFEIKDSDVVRDDTIGIATVSLAKAREAGSDQLQVPVLSKKSKKQHGFLSLTLKWTPNSALRPAAPLQPQPQPVYYAPPPPPQQPQAPAPLFYPQMYANAPPPGTVQDPYYPTAAPHVGGYPHPQGGAPAAGGAPPPGAAAPLPPQGAYPHHGGYGAYPAPPRY